MAKAQAQEPSMEEILASIRRIIADEEPAPAPAAVAKPAAPARAVPPPPPMAIEPVADTTVSEDDLDKLFASDDVEDDVLDLGDADMSGPDAMHLTEEPDDLAFEPIHAPKPEPVRMPTPAPEPRMATPKPEPARMAPPVQKPAPRREPEPEMQDDSYSTRLDPLLSHSTDTMVSAAFDNLALSILNKNARTVEDLIQDMMRPMLKTWLDQNLPALVERLIRAEIERVARGR